MRGPLLAILLAAAVLAGCTQAPPAADVDPAADGEPSHDVRRPAPATPSPVAPRNGTAPGAGNASAPNATQPAPGASHDPGPFEWPPLGEATVRPGVQTFYGGSQCTSNFVFTSPDNGTLYLGSAAHCFGPSAKLGDPIEIGDGAATGTLAYSSWLVMGSDGGDPTTGADPTCSVEEDQRVCDLNDFALIRLDPAARRAVHPAMLHFGGPTALAPSEGVSMGDKVLTYGHSGLRFGLEETNWHEGYVLDHSEPWTTTTYTATPGVPGDSGSGVLTGDGRAFGVLVTVGLTPFAASNGVTSLDLALAYAKEKGGVDARLATWDLLDQGLLPRA